MDTRSLYVDVGNILRRFHDLERPKKLTVIYGKRFDNEPYVVLCARELTEAVSRALGGLQLAGVTKQRVERYCNGLGRLSKEIEKAANNGRRLNKRVLSKTIIQHREAFHSILEARIRVSIGSDQWSRVLLSAVAVWGDQF